MTASFNGMPIILLGLALVVMHAALTGSKGWGLGSCTVAAMLVPFVLARGQPSGARTFLWPSGRSRDRP